ncbi:hypothetical protein MJC1_02805 [Methylocystis sp. MJC1]|nr:hypothetical protein MJC1_02805 [Methylocystis sp. MJC1]
MSVPTHGASCQTWVYPTSCWYCSSSIHVLQCTCGSAVLLNYVGPPWPKHQCASPGTAGIGGSGLSGWAAVDALRSEGVPIDANIMAKIFPRSSSSHLSNTAPQPIGIRVVPPTAQNSVSVIGVIREYIPSTKKTESLNSMGVLGQKLLNVPKDVSQLTIIVNNERPNLSYTCIAPSSLGLPKDAKHKMVFAQLEPRIAGSFAAWFAIDICLL